MITRTICKTVFTCKVYTGGAIAEMKFEAIGRMKVNTDFQTVCKLFSTPEAVIVEVLNIRHEEALMGMPESDFIRCATILPDRK